MPPTRPTPGVSLLGALPVGLWVRDHATIATFSMLSVGFVALFALIVLLLATLPNTAAGERHTSYDSRRAS